MYFQENQYFSDSEHQMVSTGLSNRRMRNRTLSGLESLRSMDHMTRPGSATGLRPITPSYDDKDNAGQQFVDFNPAGTVTHYHLANKIIYIEERTSGTEHHTHSSAVFFIRTVFGISFKIFKMGRRKVFRLLTSHQKHYTTC